MKNRLVDLLQCECGKTGFTVEQSSTQSTAFSDTLASVRCDRHCAFKNTSVDRVTPADCTACYAVEVLDGTIRCVCGRTWPIVNGIPRFLPKTLSGDLKKNQDTFSYEWKMFRFGERNWGQDIEERKKLFLKGMGIRPSDLKGKLMFDAGCGSGVLSIEMANSFGMEVVALDLSFGIEEAYRHNTSPYLHFVQGSVLSPPFRGVFDYLYCAGVLITLPDTKTGFKAIVPTLKPGGRCFIWVHHPISRAYYPDAWRKLAVYDWVRSKVTSRLPIKVQYYLYLSWMPAFFVKQSIERLLGRRQNPLTWREKMQALFDFFSALYKHRHEPPEIVSWYQQEGFSNVQVAYREYEGFAVRGDLK